VAAPTGRGIVAVPTGWGIVGPSSRVVADYVDPASMAVASRVQNLMAQTLIDKGLLASS
jgi:hypothetical protein